jgi:hypothetical protein
MKAIQGGALTQKEAGKHKKGKSPAIRGEGLTPREAAERMGISYSTFNNLKRQGCLPFDVIYHSARVIRVDSMDVDEHIAFIKTVSGQNAWRQFLKEHNINKGGAAGKN